LVSCTCAVIASRSAGSATAPTVYRLVIPIPLGKPIDTVRVAEKVI
jgi:hypothetical protein